MFLPALALTLLQGAAWPGVLDHAGAALGDPSLRLGATEELARQDSPASRDLLASMLDDLDPAVRTLAARALARRGDPRALAAAGRWLSSGITAGRLAGLEVLRLAPALPAELRPLVDRVLADGDSILKQTALEALAGKGLGASSLEVVAAALEDSAPAVRLRALRILGQARDPRAALAVLARLEDPDRQVRRESIAVLGGLRESRVGPALVRQLSSTFDDVRLAAVDALGELKFTAAVPALAALAHRRPADVLARHAQRSLGRLGTAESVQVLVADLATPPVTEETRLALLDASAVAGPPLVRMLDGEEAEATAAALMLGEMHHRPAVEPLIALAARRNRALTAALRALATLASPAALPLIAQAASDRSPEVRRLAFDAMIATADDRVRDLVPAGIADADPGVRRAALVLTQRFGLRSVWKAVANRLTAVEPEASLRRQAAVTLAALAHDGEPGICAALIESFSSWAGDDNLSADVLVRVARAGNVDRLLTAVAASRSPERLPLLIGLAAALGASDVAPGKAQARRALPLLLRLIEGGGAAAEIAAAVLVRMPEASRREDSLLALWSRATAPVRARLAQDLVAVAAGRRWLTEVVLDDNGADEVRAAAAWALASVDEPAARQALTFARRATHPAVAANAAAALARPAQARPVSPVSVATVSLRDQAGRPLAGRWLRFAVGDGSEVWARTGAAGQASVPGLPPGSATTTVTAAELGAELLLHDPSDSLGQIARQ